MDEQIAAQQPQLIHKDTHWSKILLLFLIILGFITTFVSGYFLATLLSSEENATTEQHSQTPTQPMMAKTTPYPTNPEAAQDSTKFLPGKFYFEDTVMLLTKDQPQLTLVATVDRVQQDTNYAQSTRVSYFDGTNWTRQSDNKTTQDATIISNSLLKSWSTTIDPSRVLKEKVSGEITVANASLQFSTDTLQNEIAMRSLPGYTKFISNGTGTLTINGTPHQAYVLYTKIYSLNASDIQFYNQPFGVTTDWIAFWDTQGNFYHVDETSVDKPTPTYQTHQIGVMEDASGAVSKTFSVIVTRDAKSPPTEYTVNLTNPIAATLNFIRINGVNKAPNGSFTWYMGNVTGTAQRNNGEKLPGVGLIEYIHD